LINLIGNAIHYTPENGTINIRATWLENYIQVDVHDNGIGIKPEDMPHIFDRFYRGGNVKNGAVPGTGLGLAICKEIVMLHGGTITVESVPDQGSTFTFTLPFSPT
jgi:signal transduction histidine kinase